MIVRRPAVHSSLTLLQLMAIAVARLIGFHVRQARQRFYQARLVRIADRRFAISLDPFGVLDPQVQVNLFQQIRVGVDLLKHDRWRLSRSQRHCVSQQNDRPNGNEHNCPEGD